MLSTTVSLIRNDYLFWSEQKVFKLRVLDEFR